MDGHTPTYGGYSNQIVVDERYVLRIPLNGWPPSALRRSCAQESRPYPRFRYWGAGKEPPPRSRRTRRSGTYGDQVWNGVWSGSHGLQPLSNTNAGDAKRLGAANFAVTRQSRNILPNWTRHFDVIIDTVSAAHDYSAYLELLKTDGTMILVGAPDKPAPLECFPADHATALGWWDR